MKKICWIVLLLILLISTTLFAGCAKNNENRTLTLATTTSTEDSGLLDELVPAFTKKTGIKVKVVAVGSGQALELGSKGDADVLLVHSPASELEFMAKGYGVSRKSVMHNYFVIVGPVSDPAKIKNQSAVEAFKIIADKKAAFVSRGDESGTNKKELAIWEKAGIQPKGSWYKESGQGMGETLTTANQLKAYTISDEATFLTMKDKLQLSALVAGGKDLANPYTVITVSRKKYQKVHYQEAVDFSNYVVSSEGQKLIGNFGKAKYGKSIFVPDAKTS